MSKYAHEVLAPKLTQRQREKLFQFFTQLFSNGFEEGNFSAWTGTVIQGSGSLSVSSGSAHHGTYKATASNNNLSDSYCYYTGGTGYTTAYAREYVKISAYPNENNYTGFIGLNDSGQGVTKAGGGIRNNHWAAYYVTSIGGDYVYESSVTFSLGTWYCIEVKGVVNAATGEVRVYIDGTERITLTGLNTTYAGNIYGLRCGLSCWQTSTVTIIFDCCVYADAYIGVEGGVTTITVTDSVSLSDSVKTNKTVKAADTLSIADAVLRNKTVTITDSMGLADTVKGNKTLPIADVLTLADAILRNKPNVTIADALTMADAVLRNKANATLTDTLSLADAILRNKSNVTVTDAITLSDVIDVLKGVIIKTVTDSLSLSDSVLINKVLTITDALSAADAVKVNKTLLVTDILSLITSVKTDKTITITDALALVESILTNKNLKVLDSLSLSDSIVVLGAAVFFVLTVQGLSQIALEVSPFDRINLQSSKFDRINITFTEPD